VKWNLRWAAARQDIWRPSDLLTAFKEVGFEPSLSKVAQLWSKKPISVRLDELDLICQALGCTVSDLLEAEPVARDDAGADRQVRAVGDTSTDRQPSRPTPRKSRGGGSASLPPN
jgi:DNA-binding Xre family transcriptional regulator